MKNLDILSVFDVIISVQMLSSQDDHYLQVISKIFWNKSFLQFG